MADSEHRPAVRGVWMPDSWFRRAGWYYAAACPCGARTPFAATWRTALLAATTHAAMVRRRAQMIDAEVERFRAEIDAAP